MSLAQIETWTGRAREAGDLSQRRPEKQQGFGRIAGRTRVLLAGAVFLSSSACFGGRNVSIDPPGPSLPPDAAPSPRRSESFEPLEPRTTVTGEVRLTKQHAGFELGRVVVFLEPRGALEDSRPLPTATVVSETDAFAPRLAALGAGQPVVMVNGGSLSHRLFSAEAGRDRIDVPPRGSSVPVRLPSRGPVRFFCSLHTEETFVLYTSTARHVTVVEQGEPFAFDGVSTGHYTLAIWSERVAGPVRDFFVNGYTRNLQVVWIDPALVRQDRGTGDEEARR